MILIIVQWAGYCQLPSQWNLEMIESDSKYLFKFYLSKTLGGTNLRTPKGEASHC